MRSAKSSIRVALLPFLLALSLWPAAARADIGNGTVRPGLHSTRHARWHGMPGWLSQSLSSALLVRIPGNSASMLTTWLTGGINRFLSIFSPAGRGPLPAPTGMALLTVSPVAGVESSGYGYRRDPINRRRKFHKGVDYRADRGTPVYAAGPGVVQVARRKGGYGRLVLISHGGGVETRYAHLQRIKVKRGQFVPAGTLIGTVGATGRATGPHLHFEVRRDGEPMDPRWVIGLHATGTAVAAAP